MVEPASSAGPKGAGWFGKIVFILVFAAHLAIAVKMSYGLEGGAAYYYSPEGVIRQAQVEDLFTGHSRGYEGLIGSAHWSPLLTMLLLPFAAFFTFFPPGFVYQILMCAATGLAAVYVYAGCRGILRFPRLLAGPLAAGYSFLPVPALLGWRGEWPAFFILCFLGAGYHFYRYLRRAALPLAEAEGGFQGREATELIISSLWAGMMVLTFWVSLLLVGVAALWIALASNAGPSAQAGAAAKEQRPVGKQSAMLWLYLLPALYPFGVWALFNWLIFKEPLHFLRQASFSRPVFLEDSATFLTYCLLMAGALWLLSFFLRRVSPRLLRLQWAMATVLLLAGLAVQYAVLLPGGAAADSGAAVVKRALLCRAGGEELNADGPAIRRYIKTNKRGSILLMVGYPAYEWISLNQPDFALIHEVDFEPERVMRDTRGRDLYVLFSNEQAALFQIRLAGRWERLLLRDIAGTEREGGPAAASPFQNWQLYRFMRDRDDALPANDVRSAETDAPSQNSMTERGGEAELRAARRPLAETEKAG